MNKNETNKRIIHSKEDYLKNPCRYSALPFWKEKDLVLPDTISVFHKEDWDRLREEERSKYYKLERFFRIYHDLEDLGQVSVPSGFRLRDFDFSREEDYEIGLNIIKNSYENMDISVEKLKSYRETAVFNESLWFFIEEAESEMPIAFIIGDLDLDLAEGIIEWLQVSKDFRKMGLASILLMEFLSRLKEIGNFATVSGDLDNASDPLGVYRKNGFIGEDVWYIGYGR